MLGFKGNGGGARSGSELSHLFVRNGASVYGYIRTRVIFVFQTYIGIEARLETDSENEC